MDLCDPDEPELNFDALLRENWGEWPHEPEVVSEYTVPRECLTYRPHKEVFLALVPTSEGWQTPLLLGFGDFNACPPSHVHAALARMWLREYGAEIVSMRHDTLEFRVARPPSTREEALALAELQFEYCDDIVLQGIGYIQSLAASLLASKIWYFWWD